jgi:EmrB/QacA subfamily drug resistance transporter
MADDANAPAAQAAKTIGSAQAAKPIGSAQAAKPIGSAQAARTIGSAQAAATIVSVPAAAATTAEPPIFVEPVPDARRTLVLAACLMGTFMAAVESTIVATAMPTIIADLHGFNVFSWVFTVYLLAQAVSIPVYGRLADLYGRRKMFFVGAGLFLVGSTLCGFSTNMVQLILFRLLQGFGAGGVQPVAMTILGDIYTPAERGRVQGVVSSVFGVSAVVGPSLGAFLVEHANWQLVFWVNLPVGAAAIAMIAAFLREDLRPRARRIDWLGSLLMMLAISALLAALVQQASLPRPLLLALTLGGVVALAALVLHECTTKEPMLPLELWRNRVILVGSVGGGLAAAIMMGVSAFLPAYVQGAMGQSATIAGLVLGTMSVTWACASIYGGRLMLRTSYRLAAVLGALALLLGCLLLVTLTPERGPLWAAVGSLVIGIGMGLSNTTFIVAIQAAVPWHQRGAATSSCMFLRFLGQSVGTASFGAVLNLTLLHRAPDLVTQADRLLDPARRGDLAPAALARLTDAMAAGLHNDYLFACGLAVLTLLLSSLLPARLSPRSQPLRR